MNDFIFNMFTRVNPVRLFVSVSVVSVCQLPSDPCVDSGRGGYHQWTMCPAATMPAPAVLDFLLSGCRNWTMLRPYDADDGKAAASDYNKSVSLCRSDRTYSTQTVNPSPSCTGHSALILLWLHVVQITPLRCRWPWCWLKAVNFVDFIIGEWKKKLF